MDRRTRDELMRRLRHDADRICHAFGLRYRSLQAERANVKSRYGICYDDGSIKIRLRHASTGAPLKYSSLVNTLCHELAHLKHFDHGPRFQLFYARILEWARKEGIYRPGRRPEGVTAARSEAEGWRGRPQAKPGAGFDAPPRPRPETPAPPAPVVRAPRRPARPSKPVQLDLFA